MPTGQRCQSKLNQQLEDLTFTSTASQYMYLSNTNQLITQLVNSLLWFTRTSLHNIFTLVFFILTPRFKYLDRSFTKLSFHLDFNGFTIDLFNTLPSDKTSAIYTTRQLFTLYLKHVYWYLALLPQDSNTRRGPSLSLAFTFTSMASQ